MKFKLILMTGSLALSLASYGSETLESKASGRGAKKAHAKTQSRATTKEITNLHARLSNIDPLIINEFFRAGEENFEFPYDNYHGDKKEGDIHDHIGCKTIEVNAGYTALVLKHDRFLFRKGPKVNLPPRFQELCRENERPWQRGGYQTKSVVPINQNLIEHGTRTIIRVGSDEIVYMDDIHNGRPIYLLRGSHAFNNINIKFRGRYNLSASKFKAGPATFVQVNVGQMGIVNNGDGGIGILKPGFHLVMEPDTFNTTISTQQEYVELKTDTGHTGTYTTKEGIPLIIPATLYFNITDPIKAFTLGFDSYEDLKATLKNQAISVLSNTIRGNALSDVGGKSGEEKTKTQEQGDHDYEKFSEETQGEFLKRFRENFGEKYGIEIESLIMKDFKYANQSMLDQMAQQSIENAKIDAQRAAIEKKKQVQLEQARADEEVKMLKAKTTVKEAEAHAEADKIRVLAEHEATLEAYKAREAAELETYKAKKAAELAAFAAKRDAEIKFEVERINLLGETKHGRDIMLAEIMARALGANTVLATPDFPLQMMQGNFLKNFSANKKPAED